MFSELERLDINWDGFLVRLNSSKSLFERLSDEFTLHLKNILSYLIYRHFINVSIDYDLQTSLSFCILCCYIIGFISETIDEIPEIARMFSCEIEYSDENIEKIIEAI